MRYHLKNIRSHGKYKAQCVANRDIPFWVNVTARTVTVLAQLKRDGIKTFIAVFNIFTISPMSLRSSEVTVRTIVFSVHKLEIFP